MTVPVELMIALFGLIGAITFGIVNSVMSLRKSARSDGEEHGEIAQKLDNMLTILTDVKRDMDGIKRENLDNRERIVRVEAHAEHTDKSVDTLFKKRRFLEAQANIKEG